MELGRVCVNFELLTQITNLDGKKKTLRLNANVQFLICPLKARTRYTKILLAFQSSSQLTFTNSRAPGSHYQDKGDMNWPATSSLAHPGL